MILDILRRSNGVKKILIKIIASCFYLGYAPLAGGSLASGAGVFLYLFLQSSFIIYLMTTLALITVGILITRRAEKIFGAKDSPKIVIDELAATLVVLFMIPPEAKFLIIGFVIFRLLDIVKPYPADKIEESKNRFSVMGDDLIAAVYTNLILQTVLIFDKLL
jgi:phosphatidylglycerophosphatase A